MNLRLGFSREVLALPFLCGFDSMQQHDTSLVGAKELADAMDLRLATYEFAIRFQLISFRLPFLGSFDSIQQHDTSLVEAKELGDSMDLKLSPTS